MFRLNILIKCNAAINLFATLVNQFFIVCIIESSIGKKVIVMNK